MHHRTRCNIAATVCSATATTGIRLSMPFLELGHGMDDAAQLVLDQTKSLYRCWPDIEVGDQLFV